ncbi:MAG: hypothetical protein WC663_00830 [Patescibacteria group bacterium]|jgi:hypothetical protein
MNIYVAHSRDFDYKRDLYGPIRKSNLNSKYNFVLPHENNEKPFYSKDFFKKECDVILAEVSYPSTGLGIELGWANFYNIPIICIYRKNVKLSGSLHAITNYFLEYSNSDELISGIERKISVLV